MRRRQEVRLHSIRQRSGGAHRLRVMIVAEDRAIGDEFRAHLAQMRRHGLVNDTPSGREDDQSGSPVISVSNPLSAREREVLGMLVRGLPNKEIAGLLFIADRTVKFHAQSIYRKLDVANRTEAVSVALRRGIVALDPPVSSTSDAA
jgi:DNA-binding NarL/FixJ family response regulator